MIDFFKNLFSSDGFMPHGHCYLWRPGVVWLHVTSDALITLAYYSIPITLFYFVRKRKDLEFHWMFVCFAVFILACGSTHLMEIWNIWHPTYWLAGSIKAVTAFASVPTAVLLMKLVPQALALPSPTALRTVNGELEREIAGRKQAQAALAASRDHLEAEVNERTAELRRINEALRVEIAERKQAEEALRASEERFRHMVEGVKDYAIYMVDLDGRIITWNTGAERMKGYSSEEILGRRLSLFYEPRDVESGKPELGLKEAAATGRFEDEGWRVRKDGSRFWANVIITALNDGAGKLRGFVKVTRDMSERKRAEEASQKLQTELAHVTRLTTMGELAASIAHEINQPLGAIVNNSNVGLRLVNGTRELPKELREILSDIVHDANRTSDIVARIRALAKKSIPEKTSLQLGDVVADVLMLAQGKLAERRIEVCTELDDDLPQVAGDRVQLQQVLLNLVMNGVEAMSGVQDERRILTIGVQRDELAGRPAIRITVRDLGCGFRPEDSERLFESFYTTKSHGLGLGLWISRSIVEAHGGRLWATLNDGPGATFSCALPSLRSDTTTA
ncbi:MAG TPA: PAS domain S-box protein [Candidatus Binatia bacterium]